VVIKGKAMYVEKDIKVLEPGSYFGSTGETVHQLSSTAGEETIIYIRTNGKYSVISD
jgi:hypothetical protein